MSKRIAAAGPVEGPWALPEAWWWEPLGDLGKWCGGGTPSKTRLNFWTDGTIPWVSPKDMKRPLIDSTEDFITTEAVAGSSAKMVPANSVLCVMRSGILRHTFPVAVNTVAVTLNQDMRALSPRNDIEPRYLSYYLQFSGRAVLESASKGGTTVNSIEASRLDRHPVPLTGRQQQQKIVARIDELFAEIDDGEAALARARTDLATWRKALLKAAVTGELTADWRAANPPAETGADLLVRILDERRARWEAQPRNKKKRYVEPVAGKRHEFALPDGWTSISVDQLTADQLTGLDRGRPLQSKIATEGVPYVKMNNITLDGEVLWDDLRYINVDQDEIERFILREGDILFNTRNSLELVGKTGYVRSPPTNAVYNNNLLRIRLGNNVDSEFVTLQMNAPPFRVAMERVKRATTSVAAIYVNDIISLSLLIPPLDEQRAIVAYVRAATDGGLGNTLSLEPPTLRQSILAAAFHGDLS